MYRDKAFQNVYIMQSVYLFASSFSWSFFYLYMFKSGFTYVDFALFKIASYGFAVVLMLNMRRFETRKAVALGFFGFAALLIATPYVHTAAGLIFLGLVDGLTFPLFWIPFNVRYFMFCKGGESAYLAALSAILPAVLGIAAPLAGGMIMDSYGAAPVFWIGGIVLAVSGVYYGFRQEGSITVHLRSALAASRGIRSLVFVQGYWQAVDWLCVPLVTFYFLTSATSFGGFLSYLAVFGAFSTLYFSRMSDKSGNRVNYLYPSVLMTAATTILSAYTTDVLNWFLVRAAVGFFVAVSSPFTTSVVLDRVKNTADAMYVREIMLNSGRAAGVATILLCQLYFGGFQKAFIPSGMLLLTYPLIVEYKKLYKVKMDKRAMASEETREFHD